jgi:hypothetical protein
MQAFSSASTGLPGYSVGPAQSMGLSGPGINSAEWTPSGSDGAGSGRAAAFLNYGLPPATSSLDKYTNNDFIVQQQVIHPWNDGSHLHIAEYQIVFCNRSLTDHDLQLYTTVSLAKMNEILDHAYATFEALSNNGDPNLDDPECADFSRYLAKYGEDKLDEYHKIRKLRSPIELDRYFNAVGVAATERNEMKRFYELATNRAVMRYMTKLGILSNWNFFGVTVSVNRATGQDEIDLAQQSERVTALGVIMAKKATTHNIFGENKDLVTGADTYLVLRRVQRRGNLGPGRFEFVPYASRTQMSVPRHLSIYSDGFFLNSDGTSNKTIPRLVNSHIIPVGVVTQPAGRDAPEGIREMAAGLNGSPKTAFETIATLPTIQIQVGM